METADVSNSKDSRKGAAAFKILVTKSTLNYLDSDHLIKAYVYVIFCDTRLPSGQISKPDFLLSLSYTHSSNTYFTIRTVQTELYKLNFLLWDVSYF
jgi:hypothetical protein